MPQGSLYRLQPITGFRLTTVFDPLQPGRPVPLTAELRYHGQGWKKLSTTQWSPVLVDYIPDASRAAFEAYLWGDPERQVNWAIANVRRHGADGMRAPRMVPNRRN